MIVVVAMLISGCIQEKATPNESGEKNMSTQGGAIFTEKERVIGILNNLSYSGTPTEDVVINGEINISINEIRNPCKDKPAGSGTCYHEFKMDKNISGARIVFKNNRTIETLLIVNNTTIRFYGDIYEGGAWWPGGYQINVISPSFVSCEQNEFLCERDKRCYEFYGYCFNCLRKSYSECICMDANGTNLNFTFCGVWKSADVMEDGMCLDGKCVPLYSPESKSVCPTNTWNLSKKQDYYQWICIEK